MYLENRAYFGAGLAGASLAGAALAGDSGCAPRRLLRVTLVSALASGSALARLDLRGIVLVCWFIRHKTGTLYCYTHLFKRKKYSIELLNLYNIDQSYYCLI